MKRLSVVIALIIGIVAGGAISRYLSHRDYWIIKRVNGYLFKMDSRSGETWLFGERGWHPIKTLSGAEAEEISRKAAEAKERDAEELHQDSLRTFGF